MLTSEANRFFLSTCKAASLSPQTINYYRKKLNYLERRYPELPTTPEPVIALMAELTCKSSYTKAGYHRAYSAFYNVVSPWFKLPNPMVDEETHKPLVKRPRLKSTVMRSCSLSELGLLLSACSNPVENGVVTLFIDTGLRPGEMASLDWPSVRGQHIVVDGKTGEREIPISPRTLVALMECATGKLEGPVFVGKMGQLSPWGIWKIVRQVAKRAGVDSGRACPLGLRHSFGRQYTMNGGDVFSLQKVMGHQNIKTTEKYVDLAAEDVAQQHRRHSPLAALPQGLQGSLFARDESIPVRASSDGDRARR